MAKREPSAQADVDVDVDALVEAQARGEQPQEGTSSATGQPNQVLDQRKGKFTYVEIMMPLR